MKKLVLGLSLIAGTLSLGQAGHLAADDAGPPPGTYRIVDGKVDWGTYAGWFTFNLACQMCHGQDATGTDVAPDLRQSLKTMTPEKFADKVLERYRVFRSPMAPDPSLHDSVVGEVLQQHRGPSGLVEMPVWLADPGMKPHVLDLYAYLKARSDGAIGAGRPTIKEE